MNLSHFSWSSFCISCLVTSKDSSKVSKLTTLDLRLKYIMSTVVFQALYLKITSFVTLVSINLVAQGSHKDWFNFESWMSQSAYTKTQLSTLTIRNSLLLTAYFSWLLVALMLIFNSTFDPLLFRVSWFGVSEHCTFY